MNHCKHDINLNNACSQCAFADSRAESLDKRPKATARLCDAGSGLLLTDKPVPTGEHADIAKQRAIQDYDNAVRAYFGRGPEVIAAWERVRGYL